VLVFSKSKQELTLKKASMQYLFWVAMSICFGIYMYFSHGSTLAIEYFSAYLMEMSLSIDNIFVFVLIFSSLQISGKDIGPTLLIGVLLAIFFRIVFILMGLALLAKFAWILYLFGAFLIYTGAKLFFGNHEEENDVKDGAIYKFVSRVVNITDEPPQGKYFLSINGKIFFTRLALVILIIGITDIVFALDSIPAVFAVSRDKLVIFSSNIFAVLGLRALFFILQKAADQFDYLQQGIAIVLVFIGAKIFLELVHIHIPTWMSLASIICCIGGSIFYSIKKQ
jgi:tellurite resistance protein TerC